MVAGLSLALSSLALCETKPTPLSVVQALRWFEVKGGAEGSRIQSLRVLADRIFVLTASRDQSAVIEVDFAGSASRRARIFNRYHDFAVNAKGETAFVRNLSADRAEVVRVAAAGENILTAEVPRALSGVFFDGGRILGIAPGEILAIPPARGTYQTSFEPAAGPLYAASGASVFIVDPLSAEYLRFDVGAGIGFRLKLSAPEVEEILRSRSSPGEAAVAAIAAVDSDSLVALIPRFKPAEGAVALKFGREGKAASGYRLVLPEVPWKKGAGYGAPVALGAEGEYLVLLLKFKDGSHVVAVYQV